MRQKDKDFIEEHAQEMRMTPDGRLVWSGETRDLGNPFQMPPPERQCQKGDIIRDAHGQPILGADGLEVMRPCENWTIVGAPICIQHAGGVGRVRQLAQEQIAACTHALIGVLVEIAMDPAAENKERIAATNSLLDRGGVKAGIDVTVTETGRDKIWASLQQAEIGDGRTIDGETV
jgi:hypothetical protein